MSRISKDPAYVGADGPHHSHLSFSKEDISRIFYDYKYRYEYDDYDYEHKYLQYLYRPSLPWPRLKLQKIAIICISRRRATPALPIADGHTTHSQSPRPIPGTYISFLLLY